MHTVSARPRGQADQDRRIRAQGFLVAPGEARLGTTPIAGRTFKKHRGADQDD